MAIDLDAFSTKARAKLVENKALKKQLARMDPRRLDNLVQELHEEVFAEIDCLECANCCKTLGPRITAADVERIALSMKVKSAQMEMDFLHRDEDGDLVFNTLPCPFLDADNYCRIYEKRPKACREYPHTDRRRFYQILDLTVTNSLVCPAVFRILELLKERI